MTIVFFKEKQYLRKTSFMVVVSVIVSLLFLIFLFGILQYLSIIDPIIPGKLKFSVIRILEIILLFMIYVFVTGYLMKLETRIGAGGINYRLFPFIFKTRFIEKNNIEKFEIIQNLDLKEFGGWSIRRSFGWKKGIYVVTGRKGIKLTLTEGQNIILGTQKPEMFFKGLERMKKHK